MAGWRRWSSRGALAQDPQLRRKEALAYLQRLSFHDIDRVRKFYKAALKFRDAEDEFDFLQERSSVRHDCVHRNGKTLDGETVEVTRGDVLKLIEAARILGLEIEAFLAPPEPDTVF